MKLVHDTQSAQHVQSIDHNYIYSDVMKTIQFDHPLHHHNGFMEECQLWMAIGRGHALLVLEPTECSKSTRLRA